MSLPFTKYKCPIHNTNVSPLCTKYKCLSVVQNTNVPPRSPMKTLFASTSLYPPIMPPTNINTNTFSLSLSFNLFVAGVEAKPTKLLSTLTASPPPPPALRASSTMISTYRTTGNIHRLYIFNIDFFFNVTNFQPGACCPKPVLCWSVPERWRPAGLPPLPVGQHGHPPLPRPLLLPAPHLPHGPAHLRGDPPLPWPPPPLLWLLLRLRGHHQRLPQSREWNWSFSSSPDQVPRSSNFVNFLTMSRLISSSSWFRFV